MNMIQSNTDDVIQEMEAFYSPSTGTLFHINAHNRTTAKMLEARYDSRGEFEASTWSRKEVAVLASTESAAETVREEIPELEIVAVIESANGSDSERGN